MQTKSLYKPLLKFMLARHDIYLKRTQGAEKPWTRDPIFQKYRFCNVYRELDTVTIWIRKNIREPYADHPNLWFMLAMARQINWPETLQEIMDEGGWPVDGYDWKKVRKIMLARQARGDKLYTGAYMLNAHGTKPDDPKDKAFFTTKYVLSDLWAHRADGLRVLDQQSLEKMAAFLTKFHGWASFTSAQAVADIKYTAQLGLAADWWTWASPGPGSIRGLNVVLGDPTDFRRPPTDWLARVNDVRSYVNANWSNQPLHAQDMQNCLCEYFKYTRGWSRSKYDGLSS